MNWNAFKRLFHYLGRYKLRLILVMIAAVLSTLFTVLTPAVTGGITSELYDGVASGSFDWETIVWLLVPWAQDILDAIESGRVNLDHYLLDQWRLMHIGAQPVPRPGEDTDKLAKLFDSGKIRLIIATPTHGRDPMRAGFRLRRMAVEYGIACVTSIDTAKLLMKCVKLGKKAEDVPPLGLHDLIL